MAVYTTWMGSIPDSRRQSCQRSERDLKHRLHAFQGLCPSNTGITALNERQINMTCYECHFYGGPQLSHQNQMLTANYKALTSNSNRSHQIQIAHSKLQITHSKLQITHSKLQIAHSKLQITHSKLQIAHSKLQIAHSKFKSPTANYKLLTPLGVFGYLQPAVQLV